MPGPGRTPPLLRRCVVKVAQQYGDTSKAFAICTAQMQKGGYVKKGSNTLTAKGKKRQTSKMKEPGHAAAMDDYERLLKQNRAEHSEFDLDLFSLLLEVTITELKRR